jgi:hypothetical protein
VPVINSAIFIMLSMYFGWHWRALRHDNDLRVSVLRKSFKSSILRLQSSKILESWDHKVLQSSAQHLIIWWSSGKHILGSIEVGFHFHCGHQTIPISLIWNLFQNANPSLGFSLT